MFSLVVYDTFAYSVQMFSISKVIKLYSQTRLKQPPLGKNMKAILYISTEAMRGECHEHQEKSEKETTLVSYSISDVL